MASEQLQTNSQTSLQIVVAKDFSETPGPRAMGEDFSGEKFKENVLRPGFLRAITDDNTILFVDLDGTEGYATSFLEAAFGGLAREFGSQKVRDHLRLKSDEEPYLVEEILRYIDDAK